jgi:hypothetical protein
MTQRAIESDLRALADDSASGLPEFAETSVWLAGGGSPYRDDRLGAEARRRALLEDRLLEVALMPHALQRVYVHRVARAAAGGAALLGAAVIMVGVLDPWTGRVLGMLSGMPLAILAPVLIGFFTLHAYILAGVFAEKHVERALRASVKTGGELYGDIDRLEAARPLDQVRRMVHGVDAVAVALPLLGASMGLTVCGFLMAFYFLPGNLMASAAYYSLGPVSLVTVLSTAFAIDLARACARERKSPSRPTVLVMAEHWGTLIAGALVGAFVLWYGARVVEGVRFAGFVPGEGKRLILIAAAVAAVVLPFTSALLWVRRREQRRVSPSSDAV